MRALQNLLGHLVLYLALALLGVMLLGATCLMWLLAIGGAPKPEQQRSSRRITAATFRGYLSVLRRIGVLRVDLSELVRLRIAGPLVIAPNHPCLLDAVFVLSRLPDAVCVMKASLWDNFFLGAGARMSGYIRNDVPLAMVRLSVQELRQGRQLLMFPEGTRTVHDPVDELKGTFAVIARRAQVPIQLVFIETDSPFLRKGWPLWRKPAFPIVYRVRVGPCLSAHSTTEATLGEVTQIFTQELTSSGTVSQRTGVSDWRPPGMENAGPFRDRENSS